MTITTDASTLTIQRDKGEPRVSRDSQLLYRLKCKLRTVSGLDWIKIPMVRDGHLVSDTQHYIATRDRKWMIYQTDHAIRDLTPAYNRYEPVTLAAVGNVGQVIKCVDHTAKSRTKRWTVRDL
jgi:hypothetical protein